MRGVLRALLTLVLAGASLGYLRAEERVTLADGGRVQTVTTYAPTVGAALTRLGIQLGPEDRVVPSPQSTIGPRIEVRRARDVVVAVNGQRRTVRVTGRTVGEILQEIGVDAGGAFVAPELDEAVEAGDQVVVAQPVNVTVVADGQSREITAAALTAGALLRQAGIELGPQDRVEPSVVAYPAAGSTIKVVRVKEDLERRSTAIPFKRVTERTDRLEYGVRQVGKAGVEGLRVRTYRITYEDGRASGRVLVRDEVVRQPSDEVSLIGTRRPVFVSHGESETGLATWFPASGLSAAHKTLPKGTVVRVTNLANGRTVDVVIRDRGPMAEERVIDLSPTAFAELSPLGRGVLDVKIEW